jgi:integrase
MRFLTASEVDRLAAAIRPPYGVLILAAAYTGLRAGELAGLRVEYLDLLAGRAEVVESITEVGGKLLAGPPKSGQRRTVALPRFLCEEFGRYLADRPHRPADLVFTMPQGGPLRQSMLSQRIFKPAVRAAGLDPALRFHDLRHTAASLLVAHGATVLAVAAQLGHASPTITLDRYAHLFPGEADQLAERLDRARAGVHPEPVWPHGGPTVIDLPARGR